jgi:hypothetical protein
VKRNVYLSALGLMSAALFSFASRASAMPVFAQAYGYDCQHCHTEVPTLNPYGRYVQRTMYAALDRRILAKTPPFWFGEQMTYDSQAAFQPHTTQFGNAALHLAGYLDSRITTHIQQWFVQNNQSGGLDTAWLSYNRVFGDATHAVIGKMPPPGPSFFSQWSDIAPFAAAQITVGEHVQTLATNRWGARLAYTNERFTGSAGWFGGSADLNGVTDFSSRFDNGGQWQMAYAPVERPIEAGFYGNFGNFPLSNGALDAYSAFAAYVQIDPDVHRPGVLLIAQHGYDVHPGPALPAAASHAEVAELSWKPLSHYEMLLSLRRENTYDGLGTFAQTTDADLAFRIARYLHATLEMGAAARGTPAWRYMVWWTTPFRSALH